MDSRAIESTVLSILHLAKLNIFIFNFLFNIINFSLADFIKSTKLGLTTERPIGYIQCYHLCFLFYFKFSFNFKEGSCSHSCFSFVNNFRWCSIRKSFNTHWYCIFISSRPFNFVFISRIIIWNP